MGKTTIDLSYKVRGDFSPNGLQKIFFSYHPDDIRQMEQVAEDILAIAECAIYYHRETFSVSEIDFDDYALKLKEMKLFVVIVTTNYLTNDSLSKKWEYGFAVQNNIPVLPIAVESDLEAYFTTEMNCIGNGYGDIQLLKTQVTDKTEISYQQKLLRDLGAMLISDKEIEKIKNAFSGQIFLSYRKKDRRYANELMHTIHNIPSLQNVSIWYDEFISSGENWSDQIGNALKNSDVFLLMVTPSIMEPDNYVIREEYPAARKQDKKVIPVEKTYEHAGALDRQKLEQLFPDLRTFVNGDSSAELEEALQELAAVDASTAEKDYLIGLAFFNGIEVEKDNEKAVSLIIASAQKNFPDAIKKLAEMYWNGDGIEVNYENSILWRKKLVDIYDSKFHEIRDLQEMEGYLGALEDLTSCLYELSSFRDSLTYGKQLVALTEQFSLFAEADQFGHYHVQAYDLCGKNCRRLGLYDDAVDYAAKYCAIFQNKYASDPSMINWHNLAVAYERMGDVYYTMGDMEQAEVCYVKAMEIDSEINDKLKSADSAYGLSSSILVLGDVLVRNGAYERADQLYSKAVELRKQILDAEDTAAHRKAYGETILARGTSLLLKGNIEMAKTIFFEARDIFVDLAEECGTIESQHACLVALNRCGKVCEREGELKKALEYYTDSLRRREKILSKIRTSETVYEYALTLFFRAGTYMQLYDSSNAKQDYEDVVDLLIPILSKERRGDWHHIFSEAAFERFKIDTFAGKKYLQYAIDGWEWLSDKYPGNKQYQKQYEICRKMYQRCYPE